jgi:pimeloyl-ACP methyl ester carboxylesterase
MTDVTGTGPAGDARLHVQDSDGDGRPVVLLHGWPLDADSWSEQVPALTGAGFRVVAYDRRGFGRSDKPRGGYDYDTFADDLHGVLEALDLRDVTLVGFSMGGGEVARYLSRHGTERVQSVVLAAAVTPYLLRGPDNPDGPLTRDLAAELEEGYQRDRDAFFRTFMTGFFSVDGELTVGEDVLRTALDQCRLSDEHGALEAMRAWATTDFRPDLAAVTVPTLVLHGEGDATVPFGGSGRRTAAAIPHSTLIAVPDAPHGFNTSHAQEFNEALLAFLVR